MTRKAALALVAGAVLIYFMTGPSSSPPGVLRDEGPAADFAFPDLAGKKAALSDFKGKVVLVNFWATWCGPCEDELPDLKKLYARYGGRGFTILGLSVDEEAAEVPPFARAHAIPFPVLLTEGDHPDGYPVEGLPTSFLISRQGHLVKKYLGQEDYEGLSADVEKALSENGK